MYQWQNEYKKQGNFSTLRKYVELYSETNLFEKISKVGLKIGVEVLFYVMLLFYLLSDKNVPLRNKLIITAALGYFILPADLIADIIPVLGFTDDAAFLSYALGSVADSITPEVKSKAKEKIKDVLNKNIDSSLFDTLTEKVVKKENAG
jgi:uncharacterized membrane protein YkvA (DUF1232 family)